GIPAGLPPKSLSNSGQRGLTGRLRSKADQEQIKIKGGSLRIVVTVGCDNLQSCVVLIGAAFSGTR
ncbi:hypothetical protein, partial [Pseudomonas sp. PM2]